jgi:hypothetical protein
MSFVSTQHYLCSIYHWFLHSYAMKCRPLWDRLKNPAAKFALITCYGEVSLGPRGVRPKQLVFRIGDNPSLVTALSRAPCSGGLGLPVSMPRKTYRRPQNLIADLLISTGLSVGMLLQPSHTEVPSTRPPWLWVHEGVPCSPVGLIVLRT